MNKDEHNMNSYDLRILVRKLRKRITILEVEKKERIDSVVWYPYNAKSFIGI